MSAVKFDKKYLELNNQLSVISPSTIFKKAVKTEKGMMTAKEAAAENLLVLDATEKLFVSRQTESVTYFLTSSPDKFVFDSDTIAFYDFGEFYRLMNLFTTPTIEQNDNKVVVSEGTSKINYLLTDPEILTKGPKLVTASGADVVFALTPDQIQNIRKIIATIGSEKINFILKDNQLVIKLFNNSHDNSFEKSYDVETKTCDELNLIIRADIFQLIPLYNYKVEILKAGLVTFIYADKDVELKLFVTELGE